MPFFAVALRPQTFCAFAHFVLALAAAFVSFVLLFLLSFFLALKRD